MGAVFIPKGTEWFIGELVEEFKVAGQAENLVHINMILIKAGSAEVAYQKAIAFGQPANMTYRNTDGVEVTVRFRGLRDLYPVHDRLEDGAELLYEEHEGLSDEAIAEMVKPKEALAIFGPT